MEQQKYRAIFFDLDGTLLPIDMDAFLDNYFKQLAVCAYDAGFDHQAVLRAVSEGTRVMMDVQDGRLNADRFWEKVESLGLRREELEPLLERFYETSYRTLQGLITPNPDAARIVAACKAKGYPLYLTTMPLFPLTAVEQRVRWAGVDPSAFERITVFDNSTSTKPHHAYFAENVRFAGVEPHEVLMVGNNTREDLSALGIGCDAYLVTDWLLDPDGFDIDTVKHGSLAEFAAWCETQLDECVDPAPGQRREGE